MSNPTTWFQLGIIGYAGPEITNGLGAFLCALTSSPLHFGRWANKPEPALVAGSGSQEMDAVSQALPRVCGVGPGTVAVTLLVATPVLALIVAAVGVHATGNALY